MKILYTTIGTLSLVLGIIGIVVPLLPTTPFLLLSAALFVRSSPRLYHWLINQRFLGNYIRNFREHKAIPLRAKIVSVCLIWITIGYCVVWIIPQTWIKAVFILIAVGTSFHILSYNTLKKERKK